MPYKDREQQREASRRYARDKKQAWLAEQHCRSCGKPGPDLSVFGAKAKGASAFTSSPARRDALLADAYCLCDGCRPAPTSQRTWNQRRSERRRAAAEERKSQPTTRPSSAPASTFLTSSEVISSRADRAAWREERRRKLGYGRGGAGATNGSEEP